MSDSFVIVCRRSRAKPCSHCGHLGSYLCDFPVTRNHKPATCDKALCGKCRTNIRDGVDLCPMHARVYESRTAVLDERKTERA